MPSLERLNEQHSEIAGKMRAIVDGAEKEDRFLSKEEQAEFDGLEVRLDQVRQQISNVEKALKADAEADSRADVIDREAQERYREQRKSFDRDPSAPLSSTEMMRAIVAWSCEHMQSRCHDQEAFALAKQCKFLGQKEIELRMDRMGQRPPRTFAEVEKQAAMRQKRAEQRATNVVGTTTLGGFTVPDEMMRSIEVALLQYGAMLGVSNRIQTSGGNPMPWPTTNDTGNVGVLVAEDALIADQEVTYGQVTLNAYKMTSKMIPVSWELLQDTAVNMETFLGELIGERLGRAINAYATTGTGTAQPQGVVAGATTSGVTAAVDDALTYAELLGLLHSVDPAYRARGGRWMSNDTTLKIVKSIVDGQQRPLWLPNVIAGEPDTLLGYPYTVNQQMASGVSAKAMLFGDFSKFTIREAGPMRLRRLDERYAEFDRVAFVGLMRFDSRLINAGTNPIKFLTMGV
jgi:HK97 family phage major capsid protein